MFSEGFLDYLCGASTDTNSENTSTTVGINVKTEPSQFMLSPPITPPESMATDEDCTSSFSFADYLAKAATQQEQSGLSMFQPRVQVKQEAEVFHTSPNANSTEGQNTATQYLLNILQGQKNQQVPPAMNTKTLEQLLQEPPILAPPSQPRTVAVQQQPQVQQPALVTQQVGHFEAIKTLFFVAVGKLWLCPSGMI